MSKYLDYLLEPEQASAAPFDQIDRFLENENQSIIEEEHQFTAEELQRSIRRRAHKIQEKRNQMDAKKEKKVDRIEAEKEKIEELEAKWRSLKKEGYQSPEEEERLDRIQGRIEKAEDRIQRWERWFEDKRGELQERVDELEAERAYYRSKLREQEHDSELLIRD